MEHSSVETFRKHSFRPIARRNVALALLATFAISAFAHVLLAYVAVGEWEISLMCGSFFLVQPIIIAAERRLAVRLWPSAAGWAWTLTALAVTSPLITEPLLQIFGVGTGTSLNFPLSIFAVVGFLLALGAVASLASLVSLPTYSGGRL